MLKHQEGRYCTDRKELLFAMDMHKIKSPYPIVPAAAQVIGYRLTDY